MKKGYPYEQLKNGDFIYCTSHYYFTCCDCGKRHIHCIDKVTKVGKDGSPSLKTNDKMLAMRIYDDKTIDRLNRKIRKWACILNPQRKEKDEKRYARDSGG